MALYAALASLSQSGADLGGLDLEDGQNGGPRVVILGWPLADFKSDGDSVRARF